jgi:hypothetical protein
VVAPPGFHTATANCPPGKNALGGGANTSVEQLDPFNPTNRSTHPLQATYPVGAPPTGWHGEEMPQFLQGGTNEPLRGFSVYVICAFTVGAVTPPPTPPVLTASATLREISVGFPEPMTQTGAASMLDPWHYTLTGGFVIDGVRAVGSQTVILTVGTSISGAYDGNHFSGDPATYLAQGGTYTLTVQNVATAAGVMLTPASTPVVATQSQSPVVGTPVMSGAYTFYITFDTPMNPASVVNNLLWDGTQLCGTTTPATLTTPDCNASTQGGIANLHWQDRTSDDCASGSLAASGGCFEVLRVDFIATVRPAPGNHTLSVSGVDDAGHPPVPSPATRTVNLPAAADNAPPTVTNVNVQLVGNQFRVRVNFNESMAHSRNGYPTADSMANTANYTLTNPDGSAATTGGALGVGAPITFTIQPSATSDPQQSTASPARYQLQQARLHLSPVGADNGAGATTTPTLNPGTLYSVTVANLRDEAGNALPTTTMTFSWPGDTTAPQVTRAFATSNGLFVDYSESMFSLTGFVPAGGFTPSAAWPNPSCTDACDRARYSSANPTFNAWLQTMISPNPGTTAGTEPISFDGQGVNFTNATALAPGTYDLIITGVNDPFGNVLSTNPTILTVTVTGP